MRGLGWSSVGWSLGRKAVQKALSAFTAFTGFSKSNDGLREELRFVRRDLQRSRILIHQEFALRVGPQIVPHLPEPFFAGRVVIGVSQRKR